VRFCKYAPSTRMSMSRNVHVWPVLTLSLYLWHIVTEQPLPPVLMVETEREEEANQQLKQATDTAARLQDELRRAAEREAQLQQQLDEMKLEMKYHNSKMTLVV